MIAKKAKKTLFLLVFSLIIIAFFFPTTLFARDITELEALDSTENLNNEEETERLDQLNYSTTTMNIRCYVEDIFYEYNETLFFTVYNEDYDVCVDFQLNSHNNYYDNINVPVGKNYLYAYIQNNYDVRSLYSPSTPFVATNDALNVICAYGTDEFIEKAKSQWDELDVYSAREEKSVIQDKEIPQKDSFATNSTESVSSTENSELIQLEPVNQEDKTDTSKRNYTFIAIGVGIFLFVVLRFFIIRIVRRRKR